MNTWRKLKVCACSLLVLALALFCTGCNDDPLPGLSSITPNIGDQGTDVLVTIIGANFSSNSRLPSIVIDGGQIHGVTTTFDSTRDPFTDTTINLPLHIDATATAGAHRIAVATWRYGYPTFITPWQTFYVRCTGCPPPPQFWNLITQPENTLLIPGGPPVTFRFWGKNFFNNNPQVQIDGDGITPDSAPPVVQQSGDLDYFDLPITAASYATSDLHKVWITTTGGPSNFLYLTVDSSALRPPPSPGATPNLTRITPDHVCKCGANINIKLEGTGFGTYLPPNVIFDNPRIGYGTTYATYQSNQDQIVVARVFIPDDIPDGSVLVRIQNQSDPPYAMSAPLVLTLDEKPLGRPHIDVQYGGSVELGGDVRAIIAGENFDPTPAVIFSGIPGLSFTNVSWDFLGRLNVDVHADATLTPVTGDEATNLTITTPNGESNRFSFRIYPPP